MRPRALYAEAGRGDPPGRSAARVGRTARIRPGVGPRTGALPGWPGPPPAPACGTTGGNGSWTAPIVDERPLVEPSARDRPGVGGVGRGVALHHHHRRRASPRQIGRPTRTARDREIARAPRGIEPDEAEPVPRVHHLRPVGQARPRPGPIDDRAADSSGPARAGRPPGSPGKYTRGRRNRRCPRGSRRPAQEQGRHGAGDARGRVAQQPPRERPSPPRLVEAPRVGLADEGAADQVVQGLDAPRRGTLRRRCRSDRASRRRSSGSRNRRPGGRSAASRRRPDSRADARTARPARGSGRPRSGTAVGLPGPSSPHESGSSRTSGWNRPAARATAPASIGLPGELRTRPGGVSCRPRGGAPPGGSSASGRDGGDQPRDTASIAAIHDSNRPPPGDRGGSVVPEARTAGRSARPRRAESAEERQGPRRLVDQNREEVALVPGGDGLEEGGDVRYQADLVNHQPRRPGLSLPGPGRTPQRGQSRVAGHLRQVGQPPDAVRGPCGRRRHPPSAAQGRPRRQPGQAIRPGDVPTEHASRPGRRRP